LRGRTGGVLFGCLSTDRLCSSVVRPTPDARKDRRRFSVPPGSQTRPPLSLNPPPSLLDNPPPSVPWFDTEKIEKSLVFSARARRTCRPRSLLGRAPPSPDRGRARRLGLCRSACRPGTPTALPRAPLPFRAWALRRPRADTTAPRAGVPAAAAPPCPCSGTAPPPLPPPRQPRHRAPPPPPPPPPPTARPRHRRTPFRPCAQTTAPSSSAAGPRASPPRWRSPSCAAGPASPSSSARTTWVRSHDHQKPSAEARPPVEAVEVAPDGRWRPHPGPGPWREIAGAAGPRVRIVLPPAAGAADELLVVGASGGEAGEIPGAGAFSLLPEGAGQPMALGRERRRVDDRHAFWSPRRCRCRCRCRCRDARRRRAIGRRASVDACFATSLLVSARRLPTDARHTHQPTLILGIAHRHSHAKATLSRLISHVPRHRDAPPSPINPPPAPRHTPRPDTELA